MSDEPEAVSPESRPKPINNKMLDMKMFIRVVAGVFSISTATAFVMALLRLISPELYYLQPLNPGGQRGIHFFIVGMMIVTSFIGFLNSALVIKRSTTQQVAGHHITAWLLIDSLFEMSRIVYLFLAEIMLKAKGPMQICELVISCAQYLLDSFLYCQVILRQ